MFYVISKYKGNLSIQGSYKSKKAAEHRVDGIKGGEVSLFETEELDPEKVLKEFRDIELRQD